MLLNLSFNHPCVLKLPPLKINAAQEIERKINSKNDP